MSEFTGILSEVVGGAAFGWCCECRVELNAEYTTADLPPCAPLRDEAIGISFVKTTTVYPSGGRTGTDLVCKLCAFKYDNVQGWWRGTEQSDTDRIVDTLSRQIDAQFRFNGVPSKQLELAQALAQSGICYLGEVEE